MKSSSRAAEHQARRHCWWCSHLPQPQLDAASPPPASGGMKYQRCRGHWLLIKKKKKKMWSSLPHRGDIKAKPSQGCWLASIPADSRYNEHVISSRFQLARDTDRDSCTLKCLHLRIPRRYQMRRRLRQTRLVPWQSAAGHGLEVTRESICCAYHMAGIERFDDTGSSIRWMSSRMKWRYYFRDPEFSLSAPRQSHKSPSYTERMHPEPSAERKALNSYSQTASLFISCDTQRNAAFDQPD